MIILLSKPDHIRHIAKRLRSELEIPLTAGYVLASKLLGYDSWPEASAHCTWSDGYFDNGCAWPDSQCCPLAVQRRREFQSATLLAELPKLRSGASLTPAEARSLIDQVRPSDGFVRPTTHWQWLAPRLADPSITWQQNQQAAAHLGTLSLVFAQRPRDLKRVVSLRLLFEGVAFREWHPSSFGTRSDPHSLYRHDPDLLSPIEALRSPRHLRPDRYESVNAALRQLQALAERVPDDLARYRDEMLDLLLQLVDVSSAWRSASQPHDTAPMTYLGIGQLHADALSICRSIPGFSTSHEHALDHPSHWPEEASWLLASLPASSPDPSSSKALRWAERRLRQGLRQHDEFRAAQAAKVLPLIRPWSVVHVNGAHRSLLATVEAPTSLDAIAAAPTPLRGRLVAFPAPPSVTASTASPSPQPTQPPTPSGARA